MLALSTAQSQNVLVEPRISAVTTMNDSESKYSIRVTSDLVLIPVTVVDQQDSFITGLEKEHFRLYDEDKEQVITHFVLDDAPVSVGFVFDASGSMLGKERKSQEAVATFLKTANPDDEFLLVEFNYRVRLVMGLTKDTSELQRRLTSLQPEGSTSLLDAVYVAIREMKNAHNARKALIVISDGGDNYSRHTLNEIENAMQEADLQIYAMGIFEPVNVRSRSIEERYGPTLLRQLTEEMAGRFFDVSDVHQLPEVGSKIGLALRNQYVLGYKPSEVKRDGKFHHVQLVLAPPEGNRKLQAFWKRGYYAPKD